MANYFDAQVICGGEYIKYAKLTVYFGPAHNSSTHKGFGKAPLLQYVKLCT
jgi:hypothetical protein